MQQHALADFHGTPVSILDHAGFKWLTAEQAGLCLGYNEANARQGVINLYNRHLDEFADDDSRELNLISRDGRPRVTRVFSKTGCHLLGFFANTPRSKEFRAFAKQFLDTAHIAGKPAAPAQPLQSTRRPLMISRRIEREVFELFLTGLGQVQIGKALQISSSTVNLLLHAKYRFSPHAGPAECSAELIAAVADRLCALELARLAEAQERIAQRFLTHNNNQALADALDAAGQRLLPLLVSPHSVVVEGGAQ